MDLKPFLKVAQRFAANNSPGILTGIGAAGAVVTAVMTARAAYRVGMDASTQYHEQTELNRGLQGEDYELPEELLTSRHLVATYWKEYIPPAIMGVTTVVAVIAANRVGARRQAAVVAAFKITDELAKEYREKVAETFGKDKEEKLNASLAKERIERVPHQQVIILGGSEILFFDAFSGRVFNKAMEDVKRAVNEINYRVNNYGWCSLSDFYDELGVGRTEISDEFGWKQDDLLEPTYTAVKMDDDRPAIQIEFGKSHIRSFNRLG